MSKRVKKTKHVYVDKYKDKANAHQAEVARDQERWAKDRLPLDEPTKKTYRNRSK